MKRIADHRAKRRYVGGVAGAVTLLAFLAVAQLVAVASGPSSAPTIAIGQLVIAHVPLWLKDFAIRAFGENDKTALLVGVYAVAVVVAVGLGALGRRRVALCGVGLLAAIAVVAALVQPNAELSWAAPSVLGGVVAAAVYSLLTKAAEPATGRARAGSQLGAPDPPADPSRRRFLTLAGGVTAIGAATLVVGRAAARGAYSAVASRAAVVLPRPTNSTPTVPGTSFDVAGLDAYITPNDRFYRVDTALVVPQLSTEAYRLRVHGMVDHPFEIGFAELLAMPTVERTVTLVCVSDPVGGPYLGNARWIGVPIRHLLDRAGVHPGADQLFMTASDGMTIGADLKAATGSDAALLAVGMNGQPLPFEHGFPVRAVIPGSYGYASACKWLVDMEVTTYQARTAYWVQRGYDQRGAIHLESKIDTPGSFASLAAGSVEVAGSAWHPGIGISRVQVKIDDGDWHEATLAAVESVDTWRLWRWRWDATRGTHAITVRAVDARGEVQTAASTGVVPGGATGLQSVVVTVH